MQLQKKMIGGMQVSLKWRGITYPVELDMNEPILTTINRMLRPLGEDISNVELVIFAGKRININNTWEEAKINVPHENMSGFYIKPVTSHGAAAAATHPAHHHAPHHAQHSAAAAEQLQIVGRKLKVCEDELRQCKIDMYRYKKQRDDLNDKLIHYSRKHKFELVD